MRSVINRPLEERDFAHEFVAILVYCEMNSPKRTTSNLILYYVLIDTMLRLAIFLVVCIFGSRIQRLFDFYMMRGLSTVVSERALVGRSRAALSSDPFSYQERCTHGLRTHRCLMRGGLPWVPGMSKEMPV